MTFFSQKPTIVTHNGDFHSDDVFGTAALLLFLNRSAQIIRTRDEAVIAQGDYVLDVGAVNDESKKRFDHHQPGGAGQRPNGIPYAAFGLVWKKYGTEICGSELVARKIDEKLVQPIDAHDNGVDLFEIKKGVSPYLIQNYILTFKPTWKEKNADKDAAFFEAVSVAKSLLSREIKKEKDREEGAQFVEQAYEASADKRLVILEEDYPWRDVLDKHSEPLFVVHPQEEGNGWKLYAVRSDKNSFKNRKDLPAPWSGKRDQELVAVTGISDATFCHNNLFIAAAKSKEGILQLAKLALSN